VTFTLDTRDGLKVLSTEGRPLASVALNALRMGAEVRAAWATIVDAALTAAELDAELEKEGAG
jgi:hypothetical protein